MAIVNMTQGGSYVFANMPGGTWAPETTSSVTPAGSGISENFTGGMYSLSTLVDGDLTSLGWYRDVQNSGGGWIQFDLGAGNEEIVTNIKITPYAAPSFEITSFTWQGSNDGGSGGTWTTLHTLSAMIIHNSGTNTIFISSPGTTPFRYYRMMDLISNNALYVVFLEISMWKTNPPELIPNAVCQTGVISENITFNGHVSMSGDNVQMRMPEGMTGTTVLINVDGEAGLQISSNKVKKDISPLSDHISSDSILKLEGSQYYHLESKREEVGFIAENAGEANPLFAVYGPDHTRDENGQKILEHNTSGRPTYQLDSNDTVPVNVNDIAILAAAVEKVKELDTRIKILKKKKN